MDWNWKYGEMAKDTEFVNNCENLKECLMEVHKILEQLLPLKAHYEQMSAASKIEYDLFLSYTLNSLFWVQLRVQGIDPTTHPIKNELDRVKAVMEKWQEIKDRKLRPTVDGEVAKRFVRNSLFDHKNNKEPPNKKIKFNED